MGCRVEDGIGARVVVCSYFKVYKKPQKWRGWDDPIP